MYDFEKTYWCNNGKYNEEYELMWRELVPDQGMADTTNGEVLRCAARIYYDAYNNGGGNYGGMGDFWTTVKAWLSNKNLNPNINLIQSEFNKVEYAERAYYEDDYYDDYSDGYRLLDVDENEDVFKQLELLLDLIIKTIGDAE